MCVVDHHVGTRSSWSGGVVACLVQLKNEVTVRRDMGSAFHLL